MDVSAVHTSGAVARARDVIDLGKPRVTTMVVFTTAVGLAIAPEPVGWARGGVILFATALLVASANILNCFLERDTDARMVRTRERPLPAGRVDPWSALALGIGAGAFAVPLLSLAANPLTAALGAFAHATYVWVYTPLKRRTPRALEIGAIPGAIPPLMGWTAATGGIATPGWILFGILFFWQLPHFIAVALYLEDDYRRGGVRVLPAVRGAEVARRWLALYTVGLVAVSLSAFAAGVAGTAYLVAAVALGAAFVGIAARGLASRVGGAWARRTFLWSLAYLTLLVTALVVDAR